MMRDVDEIELVFVLPCAAVRKIMYFAQPRYQFLYFRNEASQKFMCHSGTVPCFIRNKAGTLMTLRVVFTQVYYKRRYGTLSGIPVDALDLLFTLDSKRVILEKSATITASPGVPMPSYFGSTLLLSQMVVF